MILCFPERTRFTALVLFFAYLAYSTFMVNLIGLMYYGGTATLNFIVACVLSQFERRSALVMWLAVSHILINFIGWVMYENYYPAHYYNVASLTVSTIQVLALITGFFNARLANSDTWLCMVRCFNSWHKKLSVEKEIEGCKRA